MIFTDSLFGPYFDNFGPNIGQFLGKYNMHEARLADILENICQRHDTKCHDFIYDYEEAMEGWWSNWKEGESIEEWLCVDTAKVCCPPDTYGRKCKPCPGVKETGNACSGEGHCTGSGIRAGSGKCKCYSGYSGTLCDQCELGFYRSTEKNDAGIHR